MPTLTTRRAIAVTVALTLALASCAGANERTETESATRPVSTTAQSALFREPDWTVRHENAGEVEPLVLPEGVVALDGSAVEMYGSDGKKSWSTRVKLFEDENAAGNGEELPTIRHVDEETIALVDVGEVDGSGYVTRVHLLDLADGKTRNTVEVPGSESDIAALLPWGLALDRPTGPDAIVNADGSTEKVPADRDLQGVIGRTPLFAAGPDVGDGTGGTRKVGYDFGGKWSTDDQAPLDEHTHVTIEAHSDDLALVRWSRDSPGSLDEARSQAQLVRTGSGEVVDDDVACEPVNPVAFRTSPDGTQLVAGPVQATKDGAECIVDENGDPVDLQAVANDGRAYGVSGDQAIRVNKNGSLSTADGGDADLLGIMEGNIAVHESDGEITGSKLR